MKRYLNSDFKALGKKITAKIRKDTHYHAPQEAKHVSFSHWELLTKPNTQPVLVLFVNTLRGQQAYYHKL